MNDPTYEQSRIDANSEWKLAFYLSEMMNSMAPIGWARYIETARAILANFDIKPKEKAAGFITPSLIWLISIGSLLASIASCGN